MYLNLPNKRYLLLLLCAVDLCRVWVCSCADRSFARVKIKYYIYASPSSGEAYRDRRLTTNFEF